MGLGSNPFGGKGGISVSGAKEVKNMLDGLSPQISKTVLGKASRRGVKSVMMQAKRNVKSTSKTIAKSIGTRQKRYRRSGNISTVVGPRSGFAVATSDDQGASSKYHDPMYTAHLVEQGTDPHAIPQKKGPAVFESEMTIDGDSRFIGAVMHPGTKGIWFMKRAWEQHNGGMFRTFADTTEQLIPKEIEKYAAKARAK